MKDAPIRLLMAAGWAAVLPLAGFSIFGILTIFPLLAVLWGLAIVPYIYALGAVPAFVTAAAFELVFQRWGLARSLLPTVMLGAVTSVTWVGGFMHLTSDHVWRLFHYMNFALAVTGGVAAALMPLTRFAKDRRRWR